MTEVHPTAVVGADAKLGDSCRIGPFCVIGDQVELGDGVVAHSHVVIEGRTRIGAGCEIFPFASIGHRPQDMKYKGEASRLEIGDNNVIREHVTMNPGTDGGGMVTRVGNGCLFMMGAHIAHDCIIGDRVILANNATLAGHVEIGEGAIIGGLSAVHQFVRIGRNAMIGGMTGIEHDVIPFGLAVGERGRLQGLNLVGLKRSGMSRPDIKKIQSAYQVLFESEEALSERIDAVAAEFSDVDVVRAIVEFVSCKTGRSLLHPK